MEKVTGFLLQLIGAASRNPVCNLPFGINRYVHRDPVISPEFPANKTFRDKKDAAASGREAAASFWYQRANRLSDRTAPNELDAFSLHFPVLQEYASRPSGLNFPE